MSCGDIIAIAAAVISVIGIFISAITYSNTIRREKKILTIKEFSRIREKYPNISPNYASDDERLEYLKEMERFCVGLHNNIYDMEIVKDMSGHFLVKQYDSYMKDFVQSRRKDETEGWKYDRYEKFMKKIKKNQKENI